MVKTVFALDLAGKTFGKWTVKEKAFVNEGGEVHWDCICECGTRRAVKAGSLKSGRSSSCGCFHRQQVTSHGYTGKPTFITWQAMKQRCGYSQAINYADYGGRGITVCDRWINSFENFLSDMGEKPKGMSLDRIDVNGPYNPENCRWADNKAQQRNRSDTRFIAHEGLTLALWDWAERYGITSKLLSERLRAGWPMQKALTKPIDVSKRTKKSKLKEP